MSETPTQALSDRIAAMIDRMRSLAEERDAYRREIDAMKSRMERHERENVRLRTVLVETVAELRQE